GLVAVAAPCNGNTALAFGTGHLGQPRGIQQIDEPRARVALHLCDMAPGEAQDLGRPEFLPGIALQRLQAESAGTGKVPRNAVRRLGRRVWRDPRRRAAWVKLRNAVRASR